MVRGAQCARTFFRWQFLHEKWRSKITWLFLIHINFQKIQFFGGFCTVFLGDQEGAAHCAPHTQATFKSPAPLGLSPPYRGCIPDSPFHSCSNVQKNRDNNSGKVSSRPVRSCYVSICFISTVSHLPAPNSDHKIYNGRGKLYTASYKLYIPWVNIKLQCSNHWKFGDPIIC